MNKYNELRKTYPEFYYHGFKLEDKKKELLNFYYKK